MQTIVLSGLDDAVLSYLDSDGVHMPFYEAPSHFDEDEWIRVRSLLRNCGFCDDLNGDCCNDMDSDSESEERHAARVLCNDCRISLQSHCESLTKLRLDISNALKELGCAFVKLNWSAPLDASFMLPELKCSSPEDVFLCLKSSDRVAHDLDHAFEDCEDVSISRPMSFHLVLRKWLPTLPCSLEFRCFVRNNNIFAISQRHCAEYYPFLAHEKDSLQKLLVSFFNERLQGHFPDSDFVYDVFIERDNVYLLDFNVFALKTAPLLFSWSELLSMTSFEFRVATCPNETRPTGTDHFPSQPLEYMEQIFR